MQQVKKGFLILTVLLIGGGVWRTPASFAADKDKKYAENPAATQAKTEADAQRRILIQNVQALQNQEARILVLTQMVNQEMGNLRQMEAVFCDRYGLDVTKWRNGLYRLDQATGKFTETKPEDAKAALKS